MVGVPLPRGLRLNDCHVHQPQWWALGWYSPKTVLTLKTFLFKSRWVLHVCIFYLNWHGEAYIDLEDVEALSNIASTTWDINACISFAKKLTLGKVHLINHDELCACVNQHCETSSCKPCQLCISFTFQAGIWEWELTSPVGISLNFFLEMTWIWAIH